VELVNCGEDLILYCLKAIRVVVNEQKLSSESLVAMQHDLNDLGCTILVIKLVSSMRSDHVVHEAIQLGISLLHGGNPKVQATLLEYFKVRKITTFN